MTIYVNANAVFSVSVINSLYKLIPATEICCVDLLVTGIIEKNHDSACVQCGW